MLFMKAILLTALLYTVTEGAVSAQTNAPYVINTTGGSFQKGYYILDWSIGELSLVHHMQNSNYIITNGFLQPFTHDFKNASNNEAFSETEIYILPNPTRDILEVDFRTKQKGRIHILLVDVSGNTIYRRETTSNGDGHIEKVNMTGLASGTYFLQIRLNPFIGFTKKSGAYKIIKIK